MKNYVYGTYDEKYVKAVIVYAIDGVLYYDAEGENVVTKDELIDMFNKGLLKVSHNSSYFIPVSCEALEENGYATVSVQNGAEVVTFNSGLKAAE